MNKRVATTLFLLLTTQLVLSQEKRTYVNGTVKNTLLQPIEDAYIQNLTTKKGTVSNSDGYFEIPVKVGDWLLISNIQYQEKKFRVTKKLVEEKVFQVHLLDAANQIEEVFIEKKMTGVLALDRMKEKQNLLANLLKDLMEGFKNLSAKDLMNIKQTEGDMLLRKPPNPGTLPGFQGVGVGVGFDMYGTAKKRALRKKLNFKTAFPELLLNELSEYFFFTTLKIPKNRFNYFIEYCRVFGIEQVYKKGDVLKLIEIFKKESPAYLKMIQKNK